MLLAEVRRKYLQELQREYPEREILSFFNLLTEKYLKMSRLQVALAPEKELTVAEELDFQEALRRLNFHEPIQYIIGEAFFYGMDFKVNKNVLIPRPETEELVEWILADADSKEEMQILDIGTGSGCIAIALAKHLPQARVTAIDVSEAALELARQNAGKHGTQVNFIQQDILKAKKLFSSYDIIVSNPPYVRKLEKAEMHKNVLLHEPDTALYVEDGNPLVFYEKITLLAKQQLSSEGILYFEINESLGAETSKFLTENSFNLTLKKDIFGKDRIIKAEKA